MRPTSQGGGPENDATHGVLSTINPKLSPTKKGEGNLFGVVANSLGPSDLTEVKKIGSGNTSSIPQRPPKNETRFWQVRGILGLKIDPQEEQISKKKVLVEMIALVLIFNLVKKSSL